MKKTIGVLLLGILLLISLFTKEQRAITFTETRSTNPSMYYLNVTQSNEFKITFTHSIHLSDVEENYYLTQTNQFQFVSMIYEDLAIGMPGHAEDNQDLSYENGKWVLRSKDSYLSSFVLYNSSIHKKLEIGYYNEIYDMKAILPTGKSYHVQIEQLSLIERWKGEKMNGRE